MEKLALTRMIEETTSSLRDKDVGALATRGCLPSPSEKKMMVLLDWLVPYQVTTWDEQP
jgi:hypothetical protein